MLYDSYYAVKCEGFARVDFMVVGDKPYFMEVNTLPGMTAAKPFTKKYSFKRIQLCGNTGFTYRSFKKHKKIEQIKKYRE